MYKIEKQNKKKEKSISRKIWSAAAQNIHVWEANGFFSSSKSLAGQSLFALPCSGCFIMKDDKILLKDNMVNYKLLVHMPKGRGNCQRSAQ